MAIKWIPVEYPFDLTAFPQDQQDKMYVAWLNMVGKELQELGVKALIVIDKKGPSVGTTTNLQGAQVWVGDYKVNLLMAFTDFIDNDVPQLQHPAVRRNDPKWYAANLVERAKEKDEALAKNNLGDYVVTPRPKTGDIEV